MAGSFDIQIDDADVREALREMLARAQDPAPAMREIGEVMMESTKSRFRTERGPDGSAWAPNSPVTLERKSGSRVLTDGGYLGGTIRYQVLGGASVAVGTNLVYGAMQQFGGSRARWRHLWGDIPARPFLGVSSEDRPRIIEILADYIARSA